MSNKTQLITIIMPVFNGETTLGKVFDSLERQKSKNVIQEIIIVNDASSDRSGKLIEEYKRKSTYSVQFIQHEKPMGLANGYNEGIRLTKTEYVITMHQDMEVVDTDAFMKMLKSFSTKDDVAAYPVVLHPYEVWRHYNLWQKCLFSRFVDKKLPMLTGKFDCFRVDFLKDIGLFDSRTFRTAGEDSDLKLKIERRHKNAVNSEVEVIHLQYVEKNFSLSKLFRKEAQLAEAQGVILRRYGYQDVKSFMLNFFRQLLILGLLIPFLNIIVALVIIVYCYAYTKLVYATEYKDPRIYLVPFVNIALLFVSFYAATVGFVRGKQRI